MEGVKRGDVVMIAVDGDYGKPCPALVVQADALAALPSVTVSRLTSDIHAGHPVRITVPATDETGLRAPSQVMIDKTVSIPRQRGWAIIGRLDDTHMLAVSEALLGILGLGGPAN